MKIIKIIRDLFFKKPEIKKREEANNRENVISSDFIDYDGMGNQGRFPPSGEKNERKR